MNSLDLLRQLLVMTGMPDDLMPIVQPWIEKPALTGEDVEADSNSIEYTRDCTHSRPY